MHLTATSARQVPTEMVVEIAFGLEQAEDVAARYGYSAVEFLELSQQAWFDRAVETKKRELVEQGWTFRSKMSVLAEDLLTDAYVSAKASESAAIKLEVAKYLTKVADLEPKDRTGAQPGGGFMININLGSGDTGGTTYTVMSPKDVIGADADGSPDDLPPLPDYLRGFPSDDGLLGAEAV